MLAIAAASGLGTRVHAMLIGVEPIRCGRDNIKRGFGVRCNFLPHIEKTERHLFPPDSETERMQKRATPPAARTRDFSSQISSVLRFHS